MRISLKRARQNQSAWVLTVVLAFLLASLLVFASLLYWVSSNTKITQRNNQFLASEYAAEAATEVALSQMNYDFLSQTLTNATFYASLPIPQTNWPVQFTFSDTNGVANQISVSIGPIPPTTQPLNSQYSGLYGLCAGLCASRDRHPGQSALHRAGHRQPERSICVHSHFSIRHLL